MMDLNEFMGKEAAGMYHSFGKVTPGVVVKYVWWEFHEELSGIWCVKQEIYKRTSNIPGRKWELVSEKSRHTQRIASFEKAIKLDNFSANWPTYEMPYLNCKIAY